MSSEQEILQNLDLESCKTRVDAMLLQSPPSGVEKLGYALGIRLALEMASEIREQKQLGSDSGVLIASWMQQYGEAQVEISIQTARDFLTNPTDLAQALEKKLF